MNETHPLQIMVNMYSSRAKIDEANQETRKIYLNVNSSQSCSFNGTLFDNDEFVSL